MPSRRKHSVHVVVRGLVPQDHEPLEEHPALVRLALDAQDLEHTSQNDGFYGFRSGAHVTDQRVLGF